MNPKRLILLVAISAAWTGGFLAASHSFSPPTSPPWSADTRKITAHFDTLSDLRRSQWNLDTKFPHDHQPRMADAILAFNVKSPLPLRTLSVDGFLTQYVCVYRGEGQIDHVVAKVSRPSPFIWPRSLDVIIAHRISVRADLEEDSSSEDIGQYTIRNGLEFQMGIPHGVVTWDLIKDKNLIYSQACLFREDIYRDGEWLKSLVAILNDPRAPQPGQTQSPPAVQK